MNSSLLIIKPPLADDHVCSAALNVLDLVLEEFLFRFVKLFVVLSRSDVEFVLGLGLRRLKGTGQNRDLGVINDLGHLRVREVLVDDDS
jgi:hypothetical protein